MGDGHRPAARIASRAGEGAQLFQIAGFQSGFVAQHAHGGGFAAFVLVHVHIAAGQRQLVLAGGMLATVQRHLQAGGAQGEQDDVHADCGRGARGAHMQSPVWFFDIFRHIVAKLN
ncbi:hypothetical protein JOS77_13510 [Chromobacterium haemolyticum]|nr:hypothetical protein JOS77_13510 [Chromobacterium haemolyticum]